MTCASSSTTIGDGKCRPAYLDLLRAYYRPLKEQAAPDCQRRLEVNPLRLLDCKVPQCQPFKADAPRITDHLCDECAASWTARAQAPRRRAASSTVHNPYLVRGLDYYTRTVFEFYPAGATGQQDALASGGRYDGLAEALGLAVRRQASASPAGSTASSSQMTSEGEEIVARARGRGHRAARR